MAIKTAEYEVNDNGNCNDCKSFDIHLVAKKYSIQICKAFDVKLFSKTQCQECREFLKTTRSEM